MRARLEALLEQHPERADLHLALAQVCLRDKDPAAAARHAETAAAMQAHYSAALLLAGRAWQAAGDAQAAREWLQRALDAARSQGDKQVERQADVFIKRLDAQA
ncbi:MAG: hypothetical protein ACPHCJ_03305 [Oceanococcaceae bacterium]